MESYLLTLQSLAWAGLSLVLVVVVTLSAIHRDTLFFQWHGWSHRLLGGLLLLWLFLGICTCHVCSTNAYTAFLFDVTLGILGISTTLTAANEFPHKYTRNEKGQSGTLHQKAIVTQSEMIEHAYYQVLNLVQALYLHMVHRVCHADNYKHQYIMRLGLLWFVTSPWLLRHRFPTHSFSDNWKVYQQSTSHRAPSKYQPEIEVILYRIKKAQYLFYKHVILHGINIFMAVALPLSKTSRNTTPPYSLAWRIFWLLLNTSYVMEFFLQSLVKRKTIIGQSTMLLLQRWLMSSASIGALVVLWQLVLNQAERS